MAHELHDSTAQELAALVASLRLYTEDQVDVPAAADTLTPVVPQYPDSLRRAGVEGTPTVVAGTGDEARWLVGARPYAELRAAVLGED
mgnify:CR=1 FL=1